MFRDRLIDDTDRSWYDEKIIEVLENEFEVAWSVETFVDVIFGDFLQGAGGSYVEVCLRKSPVKEHYYTQKRLTYMGIY